MQFAFIDNKHEMQAFTFSIGVVVLSIIAVGNGAVLRVRGARDSAGLLHGLPPFEGAGPERSRAPGCPSEEAKEEKAKLIRMRSLIIAEKPSVALRIALSLSESKPKTNAFNGVVYYEATRKGDKLYIVAAAGHLFTLHQRDIMCVGKSDKS